MKKKILTILIICSILLLCYPLYLVVKCLIANIEGIAFYMEYRPDFANYEPYYRYIRSIVEWSVCSISIITSICVFVFALFYICREKIKYTAQELKEQAEQKKQKKIEKKKEKLEKELENLKNS